jgi:hypothetical protein
MIDQDFCEFLEFELSKAFINSSKNSIRNFWCDGVLLCEPDKYYSQNFVNDNKQVLLKAFIGNDGQTEYELILKFGNKSLDRYAKSLDMKECVPNPEKEGWINIDIENKKIEIQLE